MKTKHLFLTLMMLLASATLSWAVNVTFTITPNGNLVNVTSSDPSKAFMSGWNNGLSANDGLLELAVDDYIDLIVNGGSFVSASIAAIKGSSVTVGTGAGVEQTLGASLRDATLTPTITGSNEFYILATKASKFSSIEVVFSFPDPATEVALVAEYNGVFYAMDHSLNPVRVQVVDGEFVRPEATTLAAITWYRRPSTAADAQAGDYTLETAEAGGQYLYSGRDGIGLSATTPAKPLYVVGGYYHYDNNNTFVTCQGSNFVFATSGAENAAKEYLVSSIVDYNASKHTFTRNFANTYFATICLPYNVALEDVEDYADFYTVAGTQRDASDNVTGLVMQIVETNLMAGVPYIILPKSTGDINFPLNGTKFSGNDHPTAYGLVGNLSSTTLTLGAGYYALSKNTLYHLVGAGKLNVGQYKAGYDLDGLTTGQKVTVLSGSEAHAPGRIVLDFNDSNAATGVENVESAALNWNEPVYNLMGQQVAEGATGVLIQNGKKFMIY